VKKTPSVFQTSNKAKLSSKPV